MPIAEVNGTSIYYEEAGQGRPLVLVHGFACGAAMWEPQVRAFADRYRVVTYDVRGHGASAVPESVDGFAHATVVEDLNQLLRQLGLRDVCLGGLSMGGGIAVSLALAHPELLAGLVVADAGAGSDDPERWRQAAEARLDALGKGIEAGVDYLLTEPIFATYAESSPEARRHMRSLITTHRAQGLIGALRGTLATRPTIYSLESDLKGLTVPTLVIVGQRDEACLRPSRFLADTIPGARLAVIRGIGHMSNLEDPTTFNALVDDFLGRLRCA